MNIKEFQDFYLALVGGKPEYLFSQCTTKEQQDTYGLNIGDYLNDRVQFAWLVWQEQQKKIDVIEQIINENPGLLESIVLEEIKGVLGIEQNPQRITESIRVWKHPYWETDK